MATKLILAMLLLGGCTTGDEELEAGTPQTEYAAIGQAPGWTLRIAGDRIAFAGVGPRIDVARPAVETTATGRRYATSRLIVDIVPGACRDAMSGSGFADTVTVGAAGRTLRGCGGPRLVQRND